MSATLSPVPAVAVETLAAAFGITNQAHHQAPDDWALVASERLAERFGPAIGAVLLARVVALSRYLDSEDGPQHYRKHGAANVLPGLVRAAALCELDADAGCFDRAALEALAATPSETVCPCCGRRNAA
jgi:hypothetical protein